VDAKVRRNLIKPVALFIGHGNRSFSPSPKDLRQRWLRSSQLRSRNLLNVLFTRSVFLDERFTPQADLTLEIAFLIYLSKEAHYA
jgi:hypothetical protein